MRNLVIKVSLMNEADRTISQSSFSVFKNTVSLLLFIDLLRHIAIETQENSKADRQMVDLLLSCVSV